MSDTDIEYWKQGTAVIEEALKKAQLADPAMFHSL